MKEVINTKAAVYLLRVHINEVEKYVKELTVNPDSEKLKRLVIRQKKLTGQIEAVLKNM